MELVLNVSMKYLSHGSCFTKESCNLLDASTYVFHIRVVDFDAARKVLTIGIDFVAGSRFAAPGVEGLYRVHDTQTKRLRHLNFFQHECYLEIRTPRVKLPDGRVVQIEPDWTSNLMRMCQILCAPLHASSV
jgi:hypothetical protein